jgi:hypothetical protein
MGEAHPIMNYLAHALPFLDKPYFAAATGAPDWLCVVDRQVRLRKKHVEPFLRNADPILAAVAGGVTQHLRDDAQFHGTRAFFETSGKITDLSRAVLGTSSNQTCGTVVSPAQTPETVAQNSIQPAEMSAPQAQGLWASFLGHLLCELLLDAALAAENPHRVTDYYHVMDKIDPSVIESAVNRMAPRTVGHLAFFIGEFRRARILWDYLEDGKLMERLNQVMRCVDLPLLPDVFATILPEARLLVAERKRELMNGIPVVW